MLSQRARRSSGGFDGGIRGGNDMSSLSRLELKMEAFEFVATGPPASELKDALSVCGTWEKELQRLYRTETHSAMR